MISKSVLYGRSKSTGRCAKSLGPAALVALVATACSAASGPEAEGNVNAAIATRAAPDGIITPSGGSCPGARNLTNHGGPTLSNPLIVNLFMGSYWGTVEGKRKMAVVNDAWNGLAAQSVIFQPLKEYMNPGAARVGGTDWIASGADQAPAGAPVTQVDESTITAAIESELILNRVPLPYAGRPENPIYVVYLGEGTYATDDHNGVNFGHHSYYRSAQVSQNVHYAVINYMQTFDGNEWVAYHEIAETMTDPDLNGYSDPNGGPAAGEIGDGCANGYWSGDYLLQQIWSQNACACVTAPLITRPNLVNERFWGDTSGNLVHQDGSGTVSTVFAATAAKTVASSIATYASSASGEAAWFVDNTGHLEEVSVPRSGSSSTVDWGTPPCTGSWTGSPAVTSWGEGRGDVFLEAECRVGVLRHSVLVKRLYHMTLQDGATYAFSDITPAGISIASSPAVVSRAPARIDIAVLSSTGEIVSGGCWGTCAAPSEFTWEAASAPLVGGSGSTWRGDIALGSPAAGVVRAFVTDTNGAIDYSEWTTGSNAWSASSVWTTPATACSSRPAVVATGPSSLFVACTATDGTVNGGWGDISLSGAWWRLGSNAARGPALSAWARILGSATAPVQLADANGGCLDLPGGNTTNGTKLHIWACDSGLNQMWYQDTAGAIHYAAQPSKCVDLPFGLPIDQTQLQIWDCDNGGSQDQQWSYAPDETIQKDGKCVELRNGSAANDTPVQIFGCNGTSGQHWLPRNP